MNQGGRHDTKQYTKEKKKNNETRSGASWEELALEIEGTVLKYDVGDLPRESDMLGHRSHIDETERTRRVLRCVTFERMKPSPFDGIGVPPWDCIGHKDTFLSHFSMENMAK